mmetsp:Transcript_11926/g.26337  ORF Transcript_11926/g.26337 Transcript_11926/m.26337 type:complete len:220 (-) Transcript_11926:480-1139(-)
MLTAGNKQIPNSLSCYPHRELAHEELALLLGLRGVHTAQLHVALDEPRRPQHGHVQRGRDIPLGYETVGPAGLDLPTQQLASVELQCCDCQFLSRELNKRKLAVRTHLRVHHWAGRHQVRVFIQELWDLQKQLQKKLLNMLLRDLPLKQIPHKHFPSLLVVGFHSEWPSHSKQPAALRSRHHNSVSSDYRLRIPHGLLTTFLLARARLRATSFSSARPG